MQTKPLLYGLAGFFIGGFLVAVAATTFDKPEQNNKPVTSSATPVMMDQMADMLNDKTGDEFDETFIDNMIVHHEGAVAMAKMAETQAKHEEIKQLSRDIVTAQENEIKKMRQWQKDWNYSSTGNQMYDMHGM